MKPSYEDLERQVKALKTKVEDLEGALEGAHNTIRLLRKKDSTLPEVDDAKS